MGSVQIRNLSKSFARADGERLPVLDDVSIDAAEGEFIVLLGPSGCGKSTLLNVLANIEPWDRGDVLVDGKADIRSKRYGYVFQAPRLLNWKTVRGNIHFALEAADIPRARWDSITGEAIDVVGLSHFIDAYPMTLSGGMKQRVGIARALAIEPHILLMDEPFSGLDELTARRMRLLLMEIWQRHRTTTLFVTHNTTEAAFLADRIFIFSPRPARIIREVRVDIPRPRDIDGDAVFQVHRDLVQTLVGVHQPVGAV